MREPTRPQGVWEFSNRCVPPTAILVGFALLIGPLLGLGAGSLLAASLSDQLESARVVSTLATDDAHIRSIQIANGTIVLRLETTDSIRIVAYGPDGDIRFARGAGKHNQHSAMGGRVTEDGRTMIVGEDVGGGKYLVTAFGQGGQRRFAFETRTDLMSSPTGRFFCTIHNHVTDPGFAILDTAGASVAIPFKASRIWSSRFLDDETLLVADSDTIRILDIPSHTVTATIPVRFQRYGLAPRIVLSPDRSLVAFHDSERILIVTREGREVWEEVSDDFVYEITFSGDNHWLCLLLKDSATREGFFRLLAAEHRDQRVESARIAELPLYFNDPPCERMWLSGNVLTLCAPDGMELCSIMEGRGLWSIALRFDSQSQTLGPAEKLQGLFRPLASTALESQFLRVSPTGQISILSIDKPEE